MVGAEKRDGLVPLDMTLAVELGAASDWKGIQNQAQAAMVEVDLAGIIVPALQVYSILFY